MKTSALITACVLSTLACTFGMSAHAEDGYYPGNGWNNHNGYPSNAYDARRARRQQIAGGILQAVGTGLEINGLNTSGNKGKRQVVAGAILSGIGQTIQQAGYQPPQPIYPNNGGYYPQPQPVYPDNGGYYPQPNNPNNGGYYPQPQPAYPDNGGYQPQPAYPNPNGGYGSPYKGTVPKVSTPKISVPKVQVPKFRF
jgi:hypothetical protein